MWRHCAQLHIQSRCISSTFWESNPWGLIITIETDEISIVPPVHHSPFSWQCWKSVFVTFSFHAFSFPKKSFFFLSFWQKWLNIAGKATIFLSYSCCLIRNSSFVFPHGRTVILITEVITLIFSPNNSSLTMLSNKYEVTVLGRVSSWKKNLHGALSTQLWSAVEKILFWKHLKSSQKTVWFLLFKLKFCN